ncbi:MAG TPA: SAM-dependent methyltransferase [Solirubrobacteraceae bacterium]
MSASAGAPRMGPERFERLYEASADPWGYCDSDYEREKYARTLAALPARPLGAVLEVGCSIGVFTEHLASRCERVVAVDFSPSALRLARARLRERRNVRLVQGSFPEEAPEGPWDVVVCSEVLYYLDEPALHAAVSWFAGQLRDGVCVVVVSWRGVGSSEPLRGDEVHDLLAGELAGWHALDDRQPGYRLDRFDGDAR